MQCICKNTLKQSSIGQALVSATHPRSCVSPILFGLGVDVDHVFGSRWLIDQLNKLGFCVSMDEVTRYKQSVMENDSYNIEVSKLAGSFTQWSADNVDHNVRTLDGKGSLHGMGIIFSTASKFGPSYPTPLSNQAQQIEEGRRCDQTTRHPNHKILAIINNWAVETDLQGKVYIGYHARHSCSRSTRSTLEQCYILES